jgi:signal transduction histidine kinase
MAERHSRERTPVLFMGLASAGIVLAFLASTYYWLAIGSKVSTDAVDAATASALSVKHLTAARGEALHLRVMLREALESGRDGPAVGRAVKSSVEAFATEFQAYKDVPLFPGESAIQAETSKSAETFERSVAEVVQLLEAGDLEASRRIFPKDVVPQGQQLDRDLQRLEAFNAEQQQWWAHRLDGQRRRAFRVLYIFNAVTLALAVMLMLLSARVTRLHWRLIEQREHAAQDRAEERSRFSERLERVSSASVLVWQAAATTSDLPTMLQLAVERARELTGADYAAAGLGGDAEHPFDTWIFDGMTSAEAKAIGRVPRPLGLLGAVVHRGVLRVADIAKAPDAIGLPPNHPPMGPFLGIPIVGERETASGHLFLARHRGREPFDEQDERILRLLVTFVATAISNVKLNQERQAAIRQREEMVSVISHDLRSPLSVIALTASRIPNLCSQEKPDVVREDAQRISRTATRMSRLIDNLVDLSLVESRALRIRRSSQAVEPLVSEAVDLVMPLAREKSIELRSKVEGAPTVSCESDLIVRVLCNLISNAIKFTEQGGHVTVEGHSRESEVLFAVQDSGVGIAEHQLAHIFDRFWQADVSHRGTGLGLYISKGIVEAHGGRIGVKSQPGVGTTIWFTLPMRAPLAPQPAV